MRLGGGDARGQERLRRIFLTAFSALLSRAGTIIVLTVTVPMALHHLGPDRFGLWMMLSSLAAVMAFADFGIGNGVLNMVAAASGTDDDHAIRETASSALALLLAIGALFAIASVLLAYLIDWGRVFGVQSPLGRAEAGQCLLAFGLCLSAGIPLSLGTKMQLGLQQGYLANSWTGFGTLLSAVMVISAILLGAGTPVMVLALFGSQQIALLLNFAWFFLWKAPQYRPRIGEAHAVRVRDLLNLGISFFGLQFVVVVAFRVDAIIVAQFFGASIAGGYATYERLFSIVTLLVGIVAGSLWPAYGEAAERGDYRWVVATLRHSLMFSVAITLAVCLPLVLLHEWIMRAWLGHDLTMPLMFVIGLAVWKVVEALGSAIAALLNGVGEIRTQLAAALCMAVAGVVLKLTLVQHFGIAAVVWSTIIAYSCFSVVPLCYLVRRCLAKIAMSADQHQLQTAYAGSGRGH